MSTAKAAPRTSVLVPGLVALASAGALALSLRSMEYDSRGFTWFVAALVAAFSLSGSV